MTIVVGHALLHGIARKSRRTTRLDALKPPRWNFAGYCLYCTEQRCTSQRCIRLHARSEWKVCYTCGGTGETPDYRNCRCSFGLIQAAR
jgi:hypothetical protein